MILPIGLFDQITFKKTTYVVHIYDKIRYYLNDVEVTDHRIVNKLNWKRHKRK